MTSEKRRPAATLPLTLAPPLAEELGAGPSARDTIVLVRRPGPAEVDPARYFARRRRLELTLAGGVAVLFVCLWQAVSAAHLVDVQFFPSPTSVWSEAVKMAKSGTLGADVWISTKRILAGYAIGGVTGVAMGAIMGSNRTLRAALEPLLTAFYTVPKLALLPLLLLVFGIGELPRVLLIAVTVFFFMWMTTMAAFLLVPDGYLEAAKSFGATRRQLLRHVQWPCALPQIFVGLRLSIGAAVLVVVAVEYVDASSGIGWLIWNSWSLFLAPQMYVGIIVVALMGVIGTWAVKLLSRLLLPWAANGSTNAPAPF
jgi:ABC-type nitrate/sulfonate/bicarbonate transport system permease component